MPEKDGFSAREHWLEESWFRKEEERKLIEYRARLAREADHDALARVTGITDQEALLAIQEIGFTAETVSLLPLLPAIEIGWLSGTPESPVRDVLCSFARQQGIEEGSSADRELARLLSVRPAESFLSACRQALLTQILASPPTSRKDRGEVILTLCDEVARRAAKRMLGRQQVPDEIRQRIDHLRGELQQISHSSPRETESDSPLGRGDE
jgi:hypothetical protein